MNLKWIKDLNLETWYYKIPRRKHREAALRQWSWQRLLDMNDTKNTNKCQYQQGEIKLNWKTSAQGIPCQSSSWDSALSLRDPDLTWVEEKDSISHMAQPKQKRKVFCTAKETSNKMKRQSVEWEKIFADHIYDNKRTNLI